MYAVLNQIKNIKKTQSLKKRNNNNKHCLILPLTGRALKLAKTDHMLRFRFHKDDGHCRNIVT